MTSETGRTPLQVLLRGRMLMWLGAGFLIGGLTALGNSARIGLQEQAYRQRGEVVQATVTAKELRPATRDRSTFYEVVFRFIDIDGRPLEGRQPVDAGTWERLGQGRSIGIQYVPGDPGSIRLAGRTRRDEAIGLLVLGLVFGGVGGGLVGWQGRLALRDWHIARNGVPASATVTGKRATSVRVNRRPQWVVTYRYTDAVGRQHDGRSPHMPLEAVQAWEPGSAVPIRFDRERPALSVWMGGVSARRRPQTPVSGAGSPARRLRRLASRYGFLASLVLGGLVLAAAAEVVPVLRDVVAYVDRHWRVLVTITGGATAVGFVLFMGGIIHLLLMGGQPAGRQGSFGTSVAEIKVAWRLRRWRHDVHWRCTFMVIGGAFMMIVGGFSSVVLLTESFVRFMFLLGLAYAVFRTAWAFHRA